LGGVPEVGNVEETRDHSVLIKDHDYISYW